MNISTSEDLSSDASVTSGDTSIKIDSNTKPEKSLLELRNLIAAEVLTNDSLDTDDEYIEDSGPDNTGGELL